MSRVEKKSNKDDKSNKKVTKTASKEVKVSVKKTSSKKDQFLGLSLEKIKKKEAKRKNDKPSIDDKIKDYFVGSFAELRKVQWPSRKVSWNLTFAVIIVTVLFGVYTTLIDFGIKQLLEKFVLGGK